MKNSEKKHILLPSTRIIIRYCLITITVVILIVSVLPFLLNYPPDSINNEFDVQMSYISYYQQFGLLCIVGLLLISISIRVLLRDIDRWYKLHEEQKFSNMKLVDKIRTTCFNLPYKLFLIELFLSIAIGVGLLVFTGSHSSILIYKIFFVLVSFAMILAVVSYVFSKDIYANILAYTYKEGSGIGFRASLKTKFLMQVMPLFLVLLFITSLVGYSRSIAEKEEIMFSIYNKALTDTFNVNSTSYTPSQIINLLNTIHLYDDSNHYWFIISPDGNHITSNGEVLTEFLIEYTKQVSPNINGKTFIGYGIDAQGSSLQLTNSQGTWYIGIVYNIASAITLNYIMINFIVLLTIVGPVLYTVMNSISKEISTISERFADIYNNTENIQSAKKLPVVSNDEIGDLVTSFNKVQELTRHNIEQIHSSQDILVERERLASLGQMIGGIAHNLKTPIMSISGAAEGLTDLIKEYNASVGDPDVTPKDHHDIAKEMNTWVEKVREYTAYMSDVITAVKGQAVTLGDNQSTDFTVDELVKRIDILMKHELKNALVELNTTVKISANTELKGNINSLVQVINNMISNAIQSYEGVAGKKIDFTLSKEKNQLIIAIKDYGPGLPTEIKNRLFKEMVTTKGKNGTGLGLFMSYSNIRAHFNGNITFQSAKGKGTTFFIHLPLK